MKNDPITKYPKPGKDENVQQFPGQPIGLVPVYVLLASDDASYITGEVYGITGGAGIA